MEKEILKIGVVGFSAPHFNDSEARHILSTILNDILNHKARTCVELVSGYTNTGIPKIAYELASELGLKTVGFSAKQALTVKCGTYPVDKAIVFGKRFGDESEAFINYIDVLIRVGGGPQSRTEVELFKQKNNNQNLSTILFEEEITWLGK